MMAIKRLDMGNIPVTEGTGKHPKEVQRYARSLVRWFKNYRDFVVQGAWYPDEVLCDQGSSHGAKYTPGDLPTDEEEILALRRTVCH